MSITILEIIENAEANLKGSGQWWSIAKDQLYNALTLIYKGYDLYDTVDVDALAKEYGSLDAVPAKTE